MAEQIGVKAVGKDSIPIRLEIASRLWAASRAGTLECIGRNASEADFRETVTSAMKMIFQEADRIIAVHNETCEVME